MAALQENLLWPLVGVIVLAVLAVFYYDDRRRLEHDDVASSEPASSESSNSEYASSSSKPATVPASHQASPASSSSKNTVADHNGFSGSIEDYFAEINTKRDAELMAAAKEHGGFSGSIDGYLSDLKPSTAPTQQSSADVQATSMSMEEYLATTGGASSTSSKHSNSGAYSGSMEGYLEKYGDGPKSAASNNSDDPVNKKGHLGFHGSYDEYAKKYN